MPSDPPKVFISYSHDSPEHRDRVLALADRLRRDGIEAWLDRYQQVPPRGWLRWMEKQIEQADFVLLVCTETYTRRFRGEESPGKGLGVTREGALIDQTLYENGAWNATFVPVVFTSTEAGHIPIVLRSVPRYDVGGDAGYELLYRRLTSQPEVVPPPLGEGRKLPPRNPITPAPPAEPRVSIAKLPATGEHFVARERELARLDAAWDDEATNVISFVAMGGTGKSALVNHWLDAIAADGWRGAERVLGWSFYSQGTESAGASSEAFTEEALEWLGYDGEAILSPWKKGEVIARLVRERRTLLLLDGLEPLQTGEADAARRHLERARELVTACGYGRREREVAWLSSVLDPAAE
ncbi:MAG: TIR domain-containing protein [bacterium]|nr:TIR domain-containing protein [bacterium]